ncbi:endo-beta-N-acetylglucosaminidase [Mycena rebaudengoi]|nr:endo-beta-N-acetylglucosaminidase [Mycena rebaudengoi]
MAILHSNATAGHRVAVYYQTQYDNSLEPNSPFGHYVSPLPLIAVISQLLAAFHINFDDVSVHLNDFVPEAPFFDHMWSDIAIMQGQGIKVIGMLGGAAPGTYDPCLLPENFDKYYPVLAHYVRKYKLDGLDLDVEQDFPIEDIVHLINRLKKDFGRNFIITLAPVASALIEEGNLSGFDYIELERRVGDKISWYNAQFYSGFGTFFPDDEYISIVEFGYGLDPSRLVATTLTNPLDGGGYVEIEDVVSSVKMLAAKYDFKFGGVAGWEYFNSNPGANQQPYLWSHIMADAMNDLKDKHDRLENNRTTKAREWQPRWLPEGK